MPFESTSPYLMEEPPTSTGRALLSRAFEHWCALHHGHSPKDIASAFEADARGDARTGSEILRAARILGELIAAGRIRTAARPVGGGSLVPLGADKWELDDFKPRIARSALDLARPFDPHAEPTHWIFVELEDFNRIVEASCSDLVPLRAPSSHRVASASDPETVEDAAPLDERLVRLPELERRTGMSRSTIYRRIGQNRFPRQVPIGGNIAAWRESEVAEWLARQQ